MRRRLHRPQVEEEEEEEEGGSLGVKVTLFVFIGILLLGGIGGGLVWFVHHNEVVKEEAARAQRADGIASCRGKVCRQQARRVADGARGIQRALVLQYVQRTLRVAGRPTRRRPLAGVFDACNGL